MGSIVRQNLFQQLKKNVIKSRVFFQFEKRKNTFKTYVVSEITQLIRREWVISFLTHQHIIDDVVP